MNNDRVGLVVTQNDLAVLASLLTGNSVIRNADESIFLVVEDTAGAINNTHQGSIMTSKAIVDQFSQPAGLISAQAFFDFITHPDIVSLTSPMGSIAPDENGHSKVGYVDGSAIIRLENINVVTYTDGFSDQDRPHRLGAVHLHRDPATGQLHRIHAMSNQP